MTNQSIDEDVADEMPTILITNGPLGQAIANQERRRNDSQDDRTERSGRGRASRVTKCHDFQTDTSLVNTSVL